MPDLTILGWNIRHGGSNRPAIARAVTEHGADLVLLSEYRQGGRRGDLREELVKLGWKYLLDSAPAPGVNGMLAASRRPLRPGRIRGPAGQEQRWLHLILEGGLEVVGAHIPIFNPSHPLKRDFWRWLTRAAVKLRSRRCVLMGDWNTGLRTVDEKGSTFHNSQDFQALLDAGWRDAYRALHGPRRTFSWWSSAGNGFRLDHAFISPSIQLKAAEYLTESGAHVLVRVPRSRGAKGLSDHAAVSVTMEP